MTKQNRIGLIVVAAILTIAAVPSAMAASKADCRTYANLAVSQYLKMQALDIGCTGFR